MFKLQKFLLNVRTAKTPRNNNYPEKKILVIIVFVRLKMNFQVEKFLKQKRPKLNYVPTISLYGKIRLHNYIFSNDYATIRCLG